MKQSRYNYLTKREGEYVLYNALSDKFLLIRVPELALTHDHTDECFAYHHRSFIWRRTAIQTETHNGAPESPPRSK